MSEEELRRTLAKLRADYAAQLPDTVAQMAQTWRRVLAAELPPAALSELLRMAHSIGGSATTFGLPAASEAARALERLLEGCADSGRLPERGAQDRIAALLAALLRAAAPG